MTDLEPRLVRCFQTVFPALSEQEIPAATQSSVPEWDSVGALTLVNVMEEGFSFQIDFEILPDLDSFATWTPSKRYAHIGALPFFEILRQSAWERGPHCA